MGRVLTQEMVFMRTKCHRVDLIKNLNLWGNELHDISVLQSMPNLEVLSLSVNQVSTLRDLQHCPKLSELYLRKNVIFDLSEVLHLRNLKNMKVIWLSDNPCAGLPFYRQYVLHHLPGLTKIDEQDVTEEERRAARMIDFNGVETCVGEFRQQVHDDADSFASDELRGDMLSPMLQHQPEDLQRQNSREQHGDLQRRSTREQPREVQRPSFRADDIEDEQRQQRLQQQEQQQSARSQLPLERRPSYGQQDDEQPLVQRRPSNNIHDEDGFGKGSRARHSQSAPMHQRMQDMEREENYLFDDRRLPQRKPSWQSAIEARTPPRTSSAMSAESSPLHSCNGVGQSQQQRTSTEVSRSYTGPDSGHCSPELEEPASAWGSPGYPAAFGNEVRRSSKDVPASAALRRSLAEQGAHSNGETRGPSAAEAWAERAVARSEGEAFQPDNGRAPRADNILCAVLALVKELDSQGLWLARRAVDQRLSEL